MAITMMFLSSEMLRRVVC